MKLAIFNIAWDKTQDDEVAKLLQNFEFTGVEIAPAKVWKTPTLVSKHEAESYKNFWIQRGITISSLCSLFYPHQDLNLFKGKQVQDEMLRYFKKICDLAELLGSEKLVFGSPRNREYTEIKSNQVNNIAVDFFSKIARIAGEKKLMVCIEPIPLQYGTNFVNSTNEAIELIRAVDSPFFRLHLDSGAMTVNQENIGLAFLKAVPFLEHFHISEENLVEIGTGDVDHQMFSDILNTYHYSKWTVIEMRPTLQIDIIGQIKRSLEYVKKVYSNEKI